MAINAQKFLPASKSYGIIKSGSSLVPKSGGTLIRIEKKVIKIDNLVKSNLVLYKKTNALARREDENKALEAKEKELEKQKPKPIKGMKMPKLPGFGFIGWIKNWIFNTILGFLAVRLIDHLPKMIKFASVVGPVMEGILDFSGILLNGMISFIDAGYKAVDATRGLVGKTFGEDGIKNFDMLSKKLTEFMNIAIIVGMASSDIGMGGLGKKGAKKAAGTVGRRGAGRVATRAGAKVAGRAGARFGAKMGSKLLKGIPFLGAGLAIAEGVMRIREGDIAGGLLSFGSAIPVAGWGFLAVDLLREFGVLKFAGGGYVKPRRYAGGGYTSPRTLSKTKTRRVAATPQKPKPGASVGGEKNVKMMFPRAPKGKETTTINPLGYLEGASKTFTSDKDLGAVFNLPIKTLMGDKPSPVDYRNAGVALSNFVSNYAMGTAGFAKGGEVERRALASGKDMSDVIARTIETSVSSEVDKVINDLMKQLTLRNQISPEMERMQQEQQMPPGEMAPGAVPGGQLTMEQLVGLAKGVGFNTDNAVIAAAIAMAESGGRTNAHNPKPPDNSYGLWQINMIGSLGPARRKQFGLSSNEDLFDAVTNAKVAYKISGGSNFSAWTTYTGGKYKTYMQAARAARSAPSLATSPTAGVSGSFNVIEYITGDPNTKVGKFDRAGHGSPDNYHDHIAFATIQDKERAKAALRAAGIQIGSELRPGDPGYHGRNLAIDVPGHQWGGKGSIGDREYAGSRRVRSILGLARGGRIVKPMLTLIGEKGQEFVFDADTTRGMDTMAPGLLEQLNAAKTKPQLAGILKTYVEDEPEVILVPFPIPTPQASSGGSGGSAPTVSVNSQDNSWMFDRLYTGTG